MLEAELKNAKKYYKRKENHYEQRRTYTIIERI